MQRDFPDAIQFAFELKSCRRHEPYTVKICRLIPSATPEPPLNDAGREDVAELQCWGGGEVPLCRRLTASTPDTTAEAALGIVDVVGRLGAHFARYGLPQPPGGARSNLSRDGSNLRPRRHGDPRSEYSGPSGNIPIGRASGSGANRVHSRHAPARWAVSHQLRLRWTWVIVGPPVLSRGRATLPEARLM